MPVDPGAGERLTDRVTTILADAEAELLRLLPPALLAGIDDRDWARSAIGRVQQLGLDLARGARGLDQAVVAEIEAVVLEAYNLGSGLAILDLDQSDAAPSVTPDPIRTAAALAGPAVEQVRAAVRRLPAMLTDTYRDAVTAGTREVLGGAVTRRAASQHVLDRLAGHGVTGFVDKAGRRWALTSYAEMSVRTAAGQAAVQGHVDVLTASGVDLVMVSDAPRECPLCRPWEGRVLSVSGGVGDVLVPSATGGPAVRVRVAGTLEQARRAGFQHPSCRHSVSAYLPGASRPGPATADPQGYDATQRQRAMERKVREWKRRGALALDDEAARRAAVKVRAWQGALREHVDTNDLKRLRGREQTGTAT